MDLPEKNGDLIVDGIPVDAFIPEFYNFDELRIFEFSSYLAYDIKYGGGACERDGIYSLSDLYGKEFADRILTRRNKLQAVIGLRELEKELCDIQGQIDRYRHFIENPSADWVI